MLFTEPEESWEPARDPGNQQGILETSVRTWKALRDQMMLGTTEGT